MAHASVIAAPFSDGGFETPVVNAPYNTIVSGTIGPWAAGNVDHIGTLWAGYGGSGQSVDLTAAFPGAVFQEFDTVAGREYQVNFALSRNSAAGTTGVLQARAAVYPTVTDLFLDLFNLPHGVLFDAKFATPNLGVSNTTPYDPSQWFVYGFRFTATQSTSVLLFQSDAANGFNLGPVLDAVSVTQTPEPASLAAWSLLCAGGAVLGWRRKLLRK
jgi:hypothetical protein